jgi:hypothetical protein
MVGQKNNIPEGLTSTVDLLRRAYPDGIPERDYFSVLALLGPEMSEKALGEAVSLCCEHDRFVVMNDWATVYHHRPPTAEIARVRSVLEDAGLSDWLAEQDIGPFAVMPVDRVRTTPTNRGYAGTYWIDEGQRPAEAEIDDLADQVEQAIADFGFERARQPADARWIVFAKRAGEPSAGVAPHFVHLHGAEDQIIISVSSSKGTAPSITIRDYRDSSEETEFMRGLKGAIEVRLFDRYQICGLEFQRQRLC